MHALPLLMGSATLLGVSYFCLDFYRNRTRLSKKPDVDMVVYDVLPCDGAESPAVNHAADGAGHCIDSGIGACIDALSHTFHH
ncbi:MAG TPA: hypothetical protein V6D06_10565 [Trichocoleus sp.]